MNLEELPEDDGSPFKCSIADVETGEEFCKNPAIGRTPKGMEIRIGKLLEGGHYRYICQKHLDLYNQFNSIMVDGATPLTMWYTFNDLSDTRLSDAYLLIQDMIENEDCNSELLNVIAQIQTDRYIEKAIDDKSVDALIVDDDGYVIDLSYHWETSENEILSGNRAIALRDKTRQNAYDSLHETYCDDRRLIPNTTFKFNVAKVLKERDGHND